MRIGELAARAYVNIDTIRYYERRGLLEPPQRLASGYRAYDADAVRRVSFIRRALDQYVAACQHRPALDACPLLQELGGAEQHRDVRGTPSMRTIVGALASRRSTCTP